MAVETYHLAEKQGGMGVWTNAMKFWRFFGAVLVFLGCLAALAGVLATAAPVIDNDHVRLILASFSEKSLDPVINTVNRVILYCINHNYFLFALGAGMMLAGGLIKTAAAKALYARAGATAAPSQRTAKPVAVPPRVAGKTVQLPVNSQGEAVAQPAAVAGLSPYTAAAYGQALSQQEGAGATSDIAAKYKPRSIIDTATVQPTPAETAAYAGSSYANMVEHDPVCAACGAKNTPSMLFCDQCGSRLRELPHGAQPSGLPNQTAKPEHRLQDLAAEAAQRARDASAFDARPIASPVPAYVPGTQTAHALPASAATPQAVPQNAYMAEVAVPNPQQNYREDFSTTFVPATVQIEPMTTVRQPAADARAPMTVSTVAAQMQPAATPVDMPQATDMPAMPLSDAPPKPKTILYRPQHGRNAPKQTPTAWSDAPGDDPIIAPSQADADWPQQNVAAVSPDAADRAIADVPKAAPARPRIISTMGRKSTR